jgi:hypothetical protein
MNTAWLFFFMLLGGLVALPLIRGWGSLVERLPLKKRRLKCLVLYVPENNRTGADGAPLTDL